MHVLSINSTETVTSTKRKCLQKLIHTKIQLYIHYNAPQGIEFYVKLFAGIWSI